MRAWLTAVAIVATLGAAGCGGGPERAPVLGECTGRGCEKPAAAHGSVGGAGATVGAPTVGPGGQQAAQRPVASGPLQNPTTGPGFGVIPSSGPGPGIGPASGPGGSGLYGGTPSPQLGPVCPALQPTPGAPCDPTANSFACTYGQRTCYCSSAWVCM